MRGIADLMIGARKLGHQLEPVRYDLVGSAKHHKGEFTEDHELDHKWSETGPIHNGRLPCGLS
jgi:hypothetical protein